MLIAIKKINSAHLSNIYGAISNIISNLIEHVLGLALSKAINDIHFI